jgi:hypothetical protein
MRGPWFGPDGVGDRVTLVQNKAASLPLEISNLLPAPPPRLFFLLLSDLLLDLPFLLSDGFNRNPCGVTFKHKSLNERIAADPERDANELC